MQVYGAHLGIGNYRTSFYMLLTLGLVLDGLEAIRSFSSLGRQDRNCCEFDSFSEPAIARTVLKDEAERQLAAFTVCRELESNATVHVPSAATRAKPSAGECPFDRSEQLSPQRASIIASMEQLRRESQELKTDVDRKLLSVYYESEMWPEFLELYLQLLQDAPANGFVVEWTQVALSRGERCGRGNDVMQALERALASYPDSKTVRGLKSALEQWASAELQGRKVRKP